MKRFTVVAIAVMVMVALAMVCSAGAADFSGKWVNYKLYINQDGEVTDINLDEEGADENDLGYVEFKDGKAYWLMTGGDADEVQEFAYKADGDKLVMELTDEMKKDSGLTNATAEIYFEGNDLVFHLKSDEGVMKSTHRRPK